MPTYSYQDFDIELNTHTETVESRGLWGFEVYHAETMTLLWSEQDKYETSGDAYFASTTWIESNRAWIEDHCRES